MITSPGVMMGRNMEIHQIIQTGQAGSSLHPVTDLECLKMQKTGLEKAMRRLGVLGKSIDDLRPRESLGSQLECDSGCVRQRCTWGLPCAHSHAFSSLSPLLSSVSLRKVEPMICWWVIWRPSQALEVKHVQPPVPFSSVQSLSRVRLCDPMNRSTHRCTLHCRSQSLCQAQGAGVCPIEQRKILRQRRWFGTW